MKIFRDKTGATAIEYGLIAALIAVAAITAIGGLTSKTSTESGAAEQAIEKPVGTHFEAGLRPYHSHNHRTQRWLHFFILTVITIPLPEQSGGRKRSSTMKKMGIITAIGAAVMGMAAAATKMAKKRAGQSADGGTSFNEAPNPS